MEMVSGSGTPHGERRDGRNQALLAWRRNVSGKQMSADLQMVTNLLSEVHREVLF